MGIKQKNKMKKSIIGGLLGGLVLFFWQFLSWGALNMHRSQMDYTPKQDKIMAALADLNLEEGEYFLPNVPEGATAEQYADYQTNMVNKPYATLTYGKAATNSMFMNLIRGFIINFLSVFLFCYLLMANPQLNFKIVVISALIVGLISYMTIPYLESIWFKSNSIPDLIDAVVQWGLAGLVLGWLLPEKNKASA